MKRSGEYVRNLSGSAEYKSFRPSPLPPFPKLLLDAELLEKVLYASSALARLDMASSLIPDPDLIVSMYVRKEALLSSQIEGTQCTLDDIFDSEFSGNSNLDVTDVINYIKAVKFASERLNTLPLCNRLIKETHECLLQGLRGSDRNPGEFRKSQNWIGPSGCSIRNAKYIPPNPEDMEKAMSDLEKYINDDEEYSSLIRAALIHYQFETIHPFLDGNGRIGRLLIPLYLQEKKLLKRPVLYISYFLKSNQTEYYDRLSLVRKNGDYEQWIKFFLTAVGNAAEDALENIFRISNLHHDNMLKLPVSSRSRNSVKEVFEYIKSHPVIDIGKTAAELGMSFNTASSAISKLAELGILKESTNHSRNRIYAYEGLLDILRSGTE